ncbi:phosphate ABC transporter permease subunit PstC [Arhodomonas aquaeolei]|uniref:phosphate ABC transporter permease subunit PstC n=1 Tax=Arhodomonas aquaeolei TaxID=2369 RepID=UPI00036B14D4|nr:phosphate ABC transporter permease subunit PstC [Arhodomonas aquaeolei]
MDTGNAILVFFGGLIPLSYAAFVMGRRRAVALARGGGERMHSRPQQYGWYAVVWMAMPAIAVALVASFAGLLGIAHPPVAMTFTAALVLAAGGLAAGLHQIRPGLRARNHLDRLVRWLLLAAALVSIATTIAIVLSIVFEAIRFFKVVSLWNFVTGTEWAPDKAFLVGAGRAGEAGSSGYTFGSVPLFAGTFMVTLIAMAVALPVGLFSAIFMSEYASRRVRGMAKPVLEVLAGIPTVVYGFFAAITVSPLIVDIAAFFGLDASYNNILSPGLVMGIMIIPFISSLSDDVINAIPQSLREGAYALGTTKSETIKQILLPAATPGIVSATLLGVSRALGETMIVVMAAGLRPNLTANPLEAMTTVTVRIVDALTGDQEFNSPATLSAFGLGLVLFIITLSLNVISAVMVRRFKQQYD